jgi:hypothetical protein
MEIAVPKQINREMEDKFENYLKKLVTGKKEVWWKNGFHDGNRSTYETKSRWNNRTRL